MNTLWFTNIDQPVLLGESIARMTPAEFLAQFPKGTATATVTVGGTVTTGDILSLTIADGETLDETVNVTAAGGDTTASLANKITDAINDDPNLQAVGLHADVTGSVITLKWSGDLGAAATLSKSLSVGATETVTLSGSTFASASGPVVPTQTFNFIYNSRIMRFRRGVPMLVTFDQLQKLVAAGMPIE